MLSAAIKGKILITEDVLTAALFDAMVETSDSKILTRLFSQAETLSRGHLELPAWERFTVQLWTQTPAGEPDVIVELLHGAHPIARILIEVKFGSGKSGEGELEDEPGRGDQLARYAVEVAKAGSTPVFVVYLTEHACLPDEEIVVSLQEIARRPEALRIKAVAWLSWRDVEGVLSAEPQGSPLGRVAQVLQRIDMFRFGGKWPDPPGINRCPSTFYRAQISYRYPPVPEIPDAWSYGLPAYLWPVTPAPASPFLYRGIS